jgi:hypothetical protein
MTSPSQEARAVTDEAMVERVARARRRIERLLSVWESADHRYSCLPGSPWAASEIAADFRAALSAACPEGQMLREALRDHCCLSDGAMLVGECVDSGRCGCTNGLLLAASPSSTPSPAGEAGEEITQIGSELEECGRQHSTHIAQAPGNTPSAPEIHTAVNLLRGFLGNRMPRKYYKLQPLGAVVPEDYYGGALWYRALDLLERAALNGTGRAAPAAGEVER